MTSDRCPHKPTFPYLCCLHRIKPEVLAGASGLPLLTAIALRVGIGTTPQIAQQAVDGLNTLLGTHYTLDDISVELHPRQR
ncbi:MAG: hypothetical protein JOZ18_22370 [Chloroflexi bacterium]|nr:hypothetical protein [Chloroflexota bacterium]